MGKYVGTVQGSKGPTSCVGSKDSGITAPMVCDRIGVVVFAYYDDENKCDVIRITGTTGSRQTGRKKIIGEVRGLERTKDLGKRDWKFFPYTFDGKMGEHGV